VKYIILICTALAVHCRKRHSDHGILKPPSTSANTYWQFEKERDPLSGEYGMRREEEGGKGEEDWKRRENGKRSEDDALSLFR